jgi:hypothetical protein
MFFPFLGLLTIPAALFAGAVILRSAVGLANRQIGPPPERPSYFAAADEDDWSDYPLPGEPDRERTGGAIPTPGILGAMGILISVAVVNFVVVMAMRMAVAVPARPRRDPLEDPDFLARLATAPIVFVLASLLLAAMLPTTIRRGLLVAFFFALIAVAVGAVIAVPIYLLD